MDVMRDNTGAEMVPHYVVPYVVRGGDDGHRPSWAIDREGEVVATDRGELVRLIIALSLEAVATWPSRGELRPDGADAIMVGGLQSPEATVRPDAREARSWRGLASQRPDAGCACVAFGKVRVEMRLLNGGPPCLDLGEAEGAEVGAAVMKAQAEASRVMADAAEASRGRAARVEREHPGLAGIRELLRIGDILERVR